MFIFNDLQLPMRKTSSTPPPWRLYQDSTYTCPPKWKPDIFILMRIVVWFWIRRAFIYRVMQSMEDMELLREYVEHDSDIAFETILNRHINLVYSAAMRQVRDAAMAGEVTQITFIILARKARSLR